MIVDLSGSNVNISFQTAVAAGTGYTGLTRTYTAQSTTDVETPAWAPISGLEDLPATGGGESLRSKGIFLP